MQKLQMEGGVGWIHQQIMFRIIVRGYSVAISKTEEINLSKLANNVTGIVRGGSSFVDLKKRLIYAIVFLKEYNEKFLATCKLWTS